jgi:hypothetical protein
MAMALKSEASILPSGLASSTEYKLLAIMP